MSGCPLIARSHCPNRNAAARAAARRRSSSRLLAAVLPLGGALLLASGATALDYSDSSPVGPQFPEWDGGNTELCFADINSDGHVDFLSIGDHGSPYINTDQHGVMVYFGDGAGGWSIHMNGNFGYGGIAVGDVNNDGLLDVGYGMHHAYSSTDFGNQLIEVALGDGTGTAWTPWDDGLATNGESYGMFATDFADIDHDGDLDLASNSFGSGNGVHVYRNNGDGSWTQTWARSAGNAQAHLCFGDVNGDGYPDIAASYQYGAIWIGDGAGGFSNADTGLPGIGGGGLAGVSLGDVDGDGCDDLSFVQNGGVHVYVWRGDHWEPSCEGLPATGIYGISRLWDMNSDGWVDVAALGDGTFTVWLGDGSGRWIPGGGHAGHPAVDSAALDVYGDVDHNGLADVVLVQEEGSWPSWRNYLYVYRETSVPVERFVTVQHPRGNQTFVLGAVVTLRWSAAQLGDTPASVDLDLSASGPVGPWMPIATGIPDSGHRQWTVSGFVTDRAHLRVTLRQEGDNVAAVSRAFRMISSDPAAADPLSPSAAGAFVRQLRVVPNPVRAGADFRVLLAAALEGGGGWLRLHDATGRLISARKVPAGVAQFAARASATTGTELPAGRYWVAFEDRQRGQQRTGGLVVLP